ncbi:MAG: response regulator transcription factor [Geminocystis sp.]|nr:response regulator transcription factor [Geminocystis sp.]MCS7148039.1 response regulator transcription factor [Geminocystis sp.]MCX8077783.1 response regulator transcription factor [Geminocystis sp.]MDW8116391.1 response regulator transcription factor [Geminocystis sp.]MDW8462124.1 response regulator transcription factor [Geminocystis sp.]
MLSLESPYCNATERIPTNSRILVVEDEELIRSMIALNLTEEGYEVIEAESGKEALNVLENRNQNNPDEKIDLIILDLMLPEVNGLDVCRFLRYQGNHVPILILSAKAGETDRVLGLEIGADDYMTKPFSMKELIARCRALLRRYALNFNCPTYPTVRQYKDITLFPDECRVIVRGKEVNLSPKEFRLLELFMTYPKRVWEREQLIQQVWGPDFVGEPKTVDVHIRWLREKLEIDPSNPEYIVTVRGFGYRFG